MQPAVDSFSLVSKRSGVEQRSPLPPLTLLFFSPPPFFVWFWSSLVTTPFVLVLFPTRTEWFAADLVGGSPWQGRMRVVLLPAILQLQRRCSPN